jgi:ABC-type maltose transport system permease subunit
MQHQAALRLALAAAYAVAALLASRAARVGAGRERRVWVFTAVAMAVLAVSKQVRFFDTLSAAARAAAKAGGWYRFHRDAQAVLVLVLGLAALVSAVLLARWLRNCSSITKLAAGVLLLLMGFVLLRAVSIHGLDVWTTTMVAGMRRGWWLEFAAAAVLCATAVSYSVTAPPKGQPTRS